MNILINGLQYDNSCFKEEFGNYLVQNGFKASYLGRVLFFYNHRYKIQVSNENVDVSVCVPELVGTENEKWHFVQNHYGISHMDLFKWMLLIHAMDVITLQQFLRNARALDHQHYTEALFLIKSILFTGTNAIA